MSASVIADSATPLATVLADIIHNTPLSACIADPSLPDCPLVAVSANFVKLCGYSRDEVLGRNCRFLNKGCELKEEHREQLRKVCFDKTGDSVFGGVLTNRKKSGEVFQNILRLRSIFVGGQRFIVGTQLDAAEHIVSSEDVDDLLNAMERRGILSKWMWSKVPASSRHSLKAAHSKDSGDSPDAPPQARFVQRVSVVPCPELLTPQHRIEESLVILVDDLVAAAMVTAMGQGSSSARCCATMAEAKQCATFYRREGRVLCGDYTMESRLLPGQDKLSADVHSPTAAFFDVGLNARDLVTDMSHQPTLLVAGVSNVPKALDWAGRSKFLVLGSLLNLSALIELIVQLHPLPVILLCAGQGTQSSRCEEHELICGYILHTLSNTLQRPGLLMLNDMARQCMQLLEPEQLWWSTWRKVRRAARRRGLAYKPWGIDDMHFRMQVDRYARVLPWFCPIMGRFLRRRARDIPGLQLALAASAKAPPLFHCQDADAEWEAAFDDEGDDSNEHRQPDYSVPSIGRRGASKCVRLFLVRHGEYDGKFVQGMAGLLDPQLNARGLEAAQRAGGFLAEEPMSMLMFSPLLRCMQTAELIARPHKRRGLIPEINHRLKAIDRGDWSGLSPKEVEEYFPGDLQAWTTIPSFKEHGGESFDELMVRKQDLLTHVLDLACERLKQLDESDAVDDTTSVCLVAHSSTVASILSLVRHAAPTGEQWLADSLRIGYCSVTMIEFWDVFRDRKLARIAYIGKSMDGLVPSSENGSPDDPPRPLLTCVELGLATQSDIDAGMDIKNAMSPKMSPGARRNEFQADAGAAAGGFEADANSLTTTTKLSIVTLPCNLGPEHDLENQLVVLIDVLRMTSTLVTAMGHGLECAKLFTSVMEVTHAVQDYGPCALLGGTQKRVLIPGFDRDNSPRSYMEGVRGRTALFITMNGTRALPWLRKAKMLVLGSFLNASALVRMILWLLPEISGVVFVCSGTERGTKRSEDDEFCAGYLLKTVLASHKNPPSLQLDDVAVSILQKMYTMDTWEAVSSGVQATPVAQHLLKGQLREDVSFSLQRDRYGDTLPIYFRDLDVFVGHHVNYNILVNYEAGASYIRKSFGGVGALAAERRIRVFLIPPVLAGQPSEADGQGAVSVEDGFEVLRRNRQLAGSFAWIDVGAVACSPSHECRVTAEFVSQRRVCVEVYSGLSPVRSGKFSGLSLSELQELYPHDFARWQKDPDWKGHGGESAREVYERATSTFYTLLRSYMDRGLQDALLVVTHVPVARGIAGAVMQYQAGEAAMAMCDIDAPLSVISIEVSVPAAVWRNEVDIKNGCRFHVRQAGAGTGMGGSRRAPLAGSLAGHLVSKL
eukprot:TRINITY_DN90181_c0_g1_i1.p1 TRINITY_DN90181_c0_g1~~TRINITY_DN90181_c0_g1_i1.p1  ORF type:complete len:1344 (+),score=220.53 TRINITY_DN90181_c0_g1_i1:112-4143(+)